MDRTTRTARSRYGVLVAAAIAATCSASRTASAQCSPESGLSPCIDASTMWLPTGPTRFIAVDGAQTVEPGRFSFGLGLSYFTEPVVLLTDSPDPQGRRVRVVDDALDVSILFGVSPAERWQLGMALPTRARQSGAGLDAVTSSTAEPLARAAARDPRLSASYTFLERGRTGRPRPFGGKAKFELSAPLGTETLLAGDRSFVGAPSVVFDLEMGRFFAAAEAGARLRKTANVGGARVGSQILTSIGIGFDVLERDRLSVGVEAWLLPTLTDQDRELDNGDRIVDAILVAGEWQASLRSSPLGDGDFTVQVAGGAGLPLSGETRITATGERSSATFSGITSPAYRLSFVLRYAPLGIDTDGDGAPDARDQCPTQAEDRDGFDDQDGCPELDNDQDRIPDDQDRCRDEAETVDGFQDEDGCPDLDDDNDGIPDERDRCRMEPEDVDGFQDSDGCPDAAPAAPEPAPPEPEPPSEPPEEPPADAPAPPDADVEIEIEG